MFGTVARMKMKPGSMDEMRRLGQQQEERNAEGFQVMLTFQSQKDPDEVWLVIGFKDEATYRANANDPQTSKMAGEMANLMAGPPEWHDGEIVAFRAAEGVAQH